MALAIPGRCTLYYWREGWWHPGWASAYGKNKITPRAISKQRLRALSTDGGTQKRRKRVCVKTCGKMHGVIAVVWRKGKINFPTLLPILRTPRHGQRIMNAFWPAFFSPIIFHIFFTLSTVHFLEPEWPSAQPNGESMGVLQWVCVCVHVEHTHAKRLRTGRDDHDDVCGHIDLIM